MSHDLKEIVYVKTFVHKNNFRPSAREVLKLPLFAKYGVLPSESKHSKRRTSDLKNGAEDPSRSRSKSDLGHEKTCKRALFPKPFELDTGSSGSIKKREPLGQINNNLTPTTTVTRARLSKSKNFARSLLNEIECAPNGAIRKRNREMDCIRHQPATKQVRHQQPLIYVTKWIDYYEQIGLGYKLSDATINILLRNGDTG